MFNIGEGYSYATVWQPTVEEKRVVCNLTTSKKLKEPNAEGKESEYRDWETDRKSTRLNSSHSAKSRMPSSA